MFYLSSLVPVTIEKLNLIDAIYDLSSALDRLPGIKYLIENIHPEPVRRSSGEHRIIEPVGKLLFGG